MTTTTKAPAPTTRVTLDVDLCPERVCTRITFASGDDAVTYLNRHSDTRAIHIIEPQGRYFGRGKAQIFVQDDEDERPSIAFGPQTEDIERLLVRLFPQCEHGMSADLCMGPDHYPSAAQEMAMGW